MPPTLKVRESLIWRAPELSYACNRTLSVPPPGLITTSHRGRLPVVSKRMTIAFPDGAAGMRNTLATLHPPVFGRVGTVALTPAPLVNSGSAPEPAGPSEAVVRPPTNVMGGPPKCSASVVAPDASSHGQYATGGLDVFVMARTIGLRSGVWPRCSRCKIPDAVTGTNASNRVPGNQRGGSDVRNPVQRTLDAVSLVRIRIGVFLVSRPYQMPAGLDGTHRPSELSTLKVHVDGGDWMDPSRPPRVMTIPPSARTQPGMPSGGVTVHTQVDGSADRSAPSANSTTKSSSVVGNAITHGSR